MSYITQLGERAYLAKSAVSNADTAQKNAALKKIAELLLSEKEQILNENKKDVLKAREMGISEVMIDRLVLNGKRIESMADACSELISMPDPVGRILDGSVRPNGLNIRRVAVPFGVIGMIYESRPNVTVDAATLCLKAGNAVMLRGGKEAFHSNRCLAEIMRRALKETEFPEDVITFVEQTDRTTAAEMMKLNKYLDVLIPRGGAGLIQSVVQNATVPVIETGVGNCHIFVDESAALDMAVSIVYNAKTSRPSVCNAAESLLVHEKIAEKFLPLVKQALDQKNVELLGCEKTIAILGDCVHPVDEKDYYTEFLDYKMSVKIVKNLEEAIEHISQYSSGHSEAIVTQNYTNAARFTKEVDSAAVYVNASTRFTDGGEFGYGAEIGISTQKLHVRGPLGLEALTSSKFIIEGNGQIRE